MNELTVFNNNAFGDLAVLEINGEPWFVGRDICEMLGYTDVKEPLKDHVDKEDKFVLLRSQFDTLERCDSYNRKFPNRGLTLINESGLYSLIIRSDLPSAREFRRWVTSEVLPSIRKHGAYATEQTIDKILQDPDYGIRLLTELKAERERSRALQTRNEELTIANKALAGEINTWDWRACVNALVRAYAVAVLNKRPNPYFRYRKKDDVFGSAWNVFYKRFDIEAHASVKNRKRPAGSKSYLDAVYEHEWKNAVKTAAAMCAENNIDIGQTLTKENLKVWLDAREEDAA